MEWGPRVSPSEEGPGRSSMEKRGVGKNRLEKMLDRMQRKRAKPRGSWTVNECRLKGEYLWPKAACFKVTGSQPVLERMGWGLELRAGNETSVGDLRLASQQAPMLGSIMPSQCFTQPGLRWTRSPKPTQHLESAALPYYKINITESFFFTESLKQKQKQKIDRPKISHLRQMSWKSLRVSSYFFSHPFLKSKDTW